MNMVYVTKSWRAKFFVKISGRIYMCWEYQNTRPYKFMSFQFKLNIHGKVLKSPSTKLSFLSLRALQCHIDTACDMWYII